MNKLVIKPTAPLNSEDSPLQTYECRCPTYKNCANNSMEDVCAFVTSDTICLNPPTYWAK